MEKNRFLEKKKKNRLFDMEGQLSIAQFMELKRNKKNRLLFDDEEINETDYYYYEYIQLVFPPDATPPTREPVKRMCIFDFSNIHNFIS